MLKVCFVCHGNICRSPAAEFVFRDLADELGLDAECCSRATHTDEIWNGRGSPVYAPMRRVIEEHGLSCSGKTACLLSSSDYFLYDMFIGMDEENRRAMTRILGGDPLGKVSLILDYTDSPGEVEDPWYTGNYSKVYSQIESGCRGLCSYLSSEGLA